MRHSTLKIDDKIYAVVPIEDYEALVEAAKLDQEDLSDRAAFLATRDEESFPAPVARAILKNPLRGLRAYRKLTLRQLSEATGLSVGYISDIEHGRKDGSVRALGALAKALGTEIGVLAR